MKQSYKSHFRNSSILAVAAGGSLMLAYRIADAAGTEDFDTRVETIEVDFEQKVAPDPKEIVAETQAASDPQTQFLFLIALTVFGMIGIGSVVRDIRRDKQS